MSHHRVCCRLEFGLVPLAVNVEPLIGNLDGVVLWISFLGLDDAVLDGWIRGLLAPKGRLPFREVVNMYEPGAIPAEAKGLAHLDELGRDCDAVRRRLSSIGLQSINQHQGRLTEKTVP